VLALAGLAVAALAPAPAQAQDKTVRIGTRLSDLARLMKFSA